MRDLEECGYRRDDVLVWNQDVAWMNERSERNDHRRTIVLNESLADQKSLGGRTNDDVMPMDVGKL